MSARTGTPVLETDRLRLARLGPDDARGPYLDWMRDPEILRYLEARFRDHDAAGLATYIETCNADDRVLMLGIFLKDGGAHIGNIKIGPVNRAHSRADVGFLIGDKACWGQGYATEAIIAITRYGFEAMGLHKVTAGIYDGNTGSYRALIKAGFREEGRRPRQYLCDGEWVDEILVGCESGPWRKEMAA